MPFNYRIRRVIPLLFILFLETLILPAQVFAQTGQNKYHISVKAQYGIDTDSENPNRRGNYLYGVHLRFDKDLSQSNKDWVKIFNAKNVSYGLTWHNLNHMNERVNGIDYPGGHAFGALTEVDFQLLKLGKMRLFATPGIGLAYITETIFTQPGTTTIGSHLNLMMTGGLNLEVPISERMSLIAGGQIQHYSNTGVKIPNGGWNALTGSLGIKTSLEGFESDSHALDAYPHIERNNLELWLGTGFRGKYRDPDKNFWRSGMYAGYNYFLNRAISLKAGSHLVYYHTVFNPNLREATFQYFGSSLDKLRWGVAAGIDVSMNRLVVNLMYGKYLHYHSYHNIQWYWVTGLRYYFTPNVGLQFTINLHRAQSDYANWGLIFRL